jgi:hypothetical protein
MATIVVAATIADKPFNGGLSWARLNWIFGLRKLGFDVYVIEEIRADRCTDENGQRTALEQSENLRYFDRVAGIFGHDRAALVCSDGTIHGSTRADLLALAESADLLVNVSGHLRMNWLFNAFRCRAYIDDDPGFTQFWMASGQGPQTLTSHEFHFTFGENIGSPDCSIPSGDVDWRPLRPFVVLEHWPTMNHAETDRFTTVASWRGPYAPVSYQGRTYGLKAHEFRRFIELPTRAPQRFELALDIHTADRNDRDLLAANRWHIVDPRTVAADPPAFQRYVTTSGAECSVAKGVYVATNSGWFSDRTVCYLAAGKPCLLQDTGFSRRYPTGEGLLAFTTIEEAVAGAETIARDYDSHSHTARTLAEDYFDSDKVLREFIDVVGISI